MAKKLLSDLMKEAEAGHHFDWCAPARKDQQTGTAAEQYANAMGEYWMHTLKCSNRPKAEEVVRAMAGKVSEWCEHPEASARLADLAANTNVKEHRDWYEANRKIGMPDECIIVGRTAYFLLKKDLDGEPGEFTQALHINGFVKSFIRMRRRHFGGTAESQMVNFENWVRTLVSEEEFCNGYE